MLSSPIDGASLKPSRTAVAAQACETCRTRKSRCDEQRPKCTLCRRLDVECTYREPLPTKKDQTMVHILNSLARLETKFDSVITSHGMTQGPSTATMPASITMYRANSDASFNKEPDPHMASDKPLTMPHSALVWPAIYAMIVNSGNSSAVDLQNVLQGGTPWFVNKEIESQQYPLSTGARRADSHSTGASLGSASSPLAKFERLNSQLVQEYCAAYFSTFNIAHPVLDHDAFMQNVMKPIMKTGFEDDSFSAVIALLVLALGQVAIQGVTGQPIDTIDSNNTPSGFRGGSLEDPPGLELFNEARRRIGFVATSISLENIQCMLLQATYFGTCARYLDYWRSIVTASMSVQVLIKCQFHSREDWRTPYGELVSRAYWNCLLSEELFHMDLDLPATGIGALDETVPWPYSQGYANSSDSNSQTVADQSYFPHHFIAMITLRKHIFNVHKIVSESPSSTESYNGPPERVLQEMAHQLETWRRHLPLPLQWENIERMGYPGDSVSARRHKEPLFSTVSSHIPISHNFNLDIVTAQLRTRFYFAKYMLYRPFVFKAIHFAELMTNEDRQHCGEAIKAALLWPMSLAPPKDKKRLVPHLYAWTSNFVSMLLVLRMAKQEGCLRDVCKQYVNPDDFDNSIALMLEWIQDVRQLDAVADWGWRILKPLYFGS